jgi:hypothetical protein
MKMPNERRELSLYSSSLCEDSPPPTTPACSHIENISKESATHQPYYTHHRSSQNKNFHIRSNSTQQAPKLEDQDGEKQNGFR